MISAKKKSLLDELQKTSWQHNDEEISVGASYHTYLILAINSVPDKTLKKWIKDARGNK